MSCFRDPAIWVGTTKEELFGFTSDKSIEKYCCIRPLYKITSERGDLPTVDKMAVLGMSFIERFNCIMGGGGQSKWEVESWF